MWNSLLCRVAAVIVAFGALSGPATADLRVCNKTTENLSIAYGYLAGNDGWTAQGWRNLAVGQCSTVLNEALQKRKYYLYAVGTKGSSWGGRDGQEGGFFCISSKKFLVSNKQYSRDGKLNCDASLRSKQFRELTPRSRNLVFSFTGGRGNAAPSPTPAGGAKRAPKTPPPAGTACERYPNLC
jgi:uncharacterized membrane protein